MVIVLAEHNLCSAGTTTIFFNNNHSLFREKFCHTTSVHNKKVNAPGRARREAILFKILFNDEIILHKIITIDIDCMI